MNEKYFEHPEETIISLNKLIAIATKKLDLAISNKEKKGNNALPPDEMNIFIAQMALQDAEKRLKAFEEELERRNTLSMGE